ncbi:MAG: hypothetical protein CMJ88_06070 [Planctomycetes bacterium]|nr:hypothetical protein [Planctomycetota bacterium]
MRRLNSPLAATAALVLLPLAASVDAVPSGLASLPHPHFPKTLICEIPQGPKITVRHLTVTFDAAGAAKMDAGEAWHLAGATFETDSDLVVGGKAVQAGMYALSARKASKGWTLTLHDGKGFSRPGDDAIVLETDFRAGGVLFEHLNCDVQPGGDKRSTRLFLDVRFDKMLARCAIDLPKK